MNSKSDNSRTQKLFLAVLEIPADQRDAWLTEQCGEDKQLLAEVRSLLKHDARSIDPLEQGVNLASTEVSSSAQPTAKQIGPYKLLQQIGEGGMGTVWMAEQERPVRRRVALKLVRGEFGSKETIARFEAERQALAMMDHNNIAKVLDAGTTDSGSPYFVMELVKGIPITQYCDNNKLGISERLELLIPVCRAVQHAHQKGIIHRDLKPSNVLVTLYDGKPVPKVIDFGLAKALEQQTKLTDKTMFTEFGQVVGTVQYMSPEQAEMNALDVDTRTDIYSLGVMLYELLTGRTPLDKETIRQNALLKVLEIIRETEPPRPSARLSSSGDAITGISKQRQITPSRLQQILRGELDWVVMKALEKDRTRRYDTASSFADDIQHYLDGEAVDARPPSTSYRLRKTIRKHTAAFAAASAFVLLLLAGLLGTGSMWIQAQQEAQRANKAEALAKEEAENARTAEARAIQEADNARASELEAQKLSAQAKMQRDLAEQNAAEASRQRDKARKNLRNARDAVDRYFTLVSESTLLDVPSQRPLRRELLNSAMDYYQDFAEQNGNDPELRAELAATYFRMAAIEHQLREPGYASLQTAIEIVEELVDANVDLASTPSFRNGMVNVRNTYGGVYDREAYARIIDLLQRGADIWERLVKDHPEVTGFKRDLAVFHGMKATAAISSGKGLVALLAVGRARNLWGQLMEQDPNAIDYRYQWAFMTGLMAAASSQMGRHERSVELFTEAKEVMEQVVVDAPDVPEYRFTLSWGLLNFAGVLAGQNRYEDAFAMSARVVELSRELVNEFQNESRYRQNLRKGLYLGADSLLRSAAALGEGGESQKSITQYRNAVEYLSPLVAEFPADIFLKRHLKRAEKAITELTLFD